MQKLAGAGVLPFIYMSALKALKAAGLEEVPCWILVLNTCKLIYGIRGPAAAGGKMQIAYLSGHTQCPL